MEANALKSGALTFDTHSSNPPRRPATLPVPELRFGDPRALGGAGVPDDYHHLTPAAAAETSDLFDDVQSQLRTLVEHSPTILFALDQHGVFTLSEGQGLKAIG